MAWTNENEDIEALLEKAMQAASQGAISNFDFLARYDSFFLKWLRPTTEISNDVFICSVSDQSDTRETCPKNKKNSVHPNRLSKSANGKTCRHFWYARLTWNVCEFSHRQGPYHMALFTDRVYEKVTLMSMIATSRVIQKPKLSRANNRRQFSFIIVNNLLK